MHGTVWLHIAHEILYVGIGNHLPAPKITFIALVN